MISFDFYEITSLCDPAFQNMVVMVMTRAHFFSNIPHRIVWTISPTFTLSIIFRFYHYRCSFSLFFMWRRCFFLMWVRVEFGTRLYCWFICSVTPSKIEIVTIQLIKSKSWDMKDDWKINSLTKTEVSAVYCSRVIWKSVLLKLIELRLYGFAMFVLLGRAHKHLFFSSLKVPFTFNSYILVC